MIVNFTVRNLKKMVPAFQLENAIRFNPMIGEGTAMTLQPVATGPDDAAFLQYTGGTTGVSKGATLSNRNIVANILQSEAWMAPALMQGAADKNAASVGWRLSKRLPISAISGASVLAPVITSFPVS